ncbi:MAG: hypothetical protein IKC80_10030 [Kiritimatiellae bacterium]|nr:hypothetical protein [Kiritimatiellia bacterium]
MFRIPVYALKPMSEPIVWRQDRKPHRTAAVSAVLTHGAADATVAGHPLGEITADPWVVQLVDGDDLEGQIAVGDTFRCGGADGSLFSVQQIISGAGAKLFVCSANERSPL